MIPNNFESWFADQVTKGLVDIKFAVTTGKGVSAAAIQSELLASEAMITSKYLKNPPQAENAIPSDVLNVMNLSVL